MLLRSTSDDPTRDSPSAKSPGLTCERSDDRALPPSYPTYRSLALPLPVLSLLVRAALHVHNILGIEALSLFRSLAFPPLYQSSQFPLDSSDLLLPVILELDAFQLRPRQVEYLVSAHRNQEGFQERASKLTIYLAVGVWRGRLGWRRRGLVVGVRV